MALPDASWAAGYLADRAHATRPDDLDRDDPRLTHPGLYSWFADEPALHQLRAALGPGIGELIYAGQTGATTSKASIGRSSTLKGRVIGQHLRAQTRGSTFSLTLAAALRSDLGLSFDRPRSISHASRSDLQLWMRDHLAVVLLPVDDVVALAQLEHDVLAVLDPPLNLMGMSETPVRRRLSQLRSQAQP